MPQAEQDRPKRRAKPKPMKDAEVEELCRGFADVCRAILIRRKAKDE